MAAPDLVLRDIHVPPAPPWWPPAPGWWLVAAVVLLVVVAGLAWAQRRRRRRAAVAAVFDRAVDAAPDPAAEVAVISELLRRAARRSEPGADRLQGDQWLALLDAGLSPRKRGGAPVDAFSAGAGRLLLDGGYRREVDPAAVAALRPLARMVFLRWMGAA